MRRQVNFFADADDEMRLHARLLQLFPGLRAFTSPGGGRVELLLHEFGELLKSDCNLMLLILREFHYELTEVSPGELFWIDISDQPVIEYQRSRLDEDSCGVKVGRLYWEAAGKIPVEVERTVSRLFQ